MLPRSDTVDELASGDGDCDDEGKDVEGDSEDGAATGKVEKHEKSDEWLWAHVPPLLWQTQIGPLLTPNPLANDTAGGEPSLPGREEDLQLYCPRYVQLQDDEWSQTFADYISALTMNATNAVRFGALQKGLQYATLSFPCNCPTLSFQPCAVVWLAEAATRGAFLLQGGCKGPHGGPASHESRTASEQRAFVKEQVLRVPQEGRGQPG